jgi:23S rRNA (pseudouridine1915-N3)-methyltransferase
MIKIICVGKIKEKYLNDACNDYLKRLSRYTKISIYEVEDQNFSDINKILKKEAELISNHIGVKDYVITLEINGKQLSSVELANKIEETFICNSTITFIIGGSYGLDETIKGRSNLPISFSKMTFPHQLFRVILLEQIYRSFKINNNEAYHK